MDSDEFKKVRKFLSDTTKQWSDNVKECFAQAQPLLNNKRIHNVGALTCSFYLLTNVFQRLAGAVTLHSGRPVLLNVAMGLATTTGSCILARDWQEHHIVPFLSSQYNSQPVLTSRNKWTSTLQNKKEEVDMIRRTWLSIGLFSLLEQRSFLTALPSSVITLGVYAQRRNMLLFRPRGAVLATDEVATGKQRKLIQSLGKRYGCHQCGSRQVFRGADSGGIFIADHQPPTKMAKAMADAWWRKWLGRGVVQQLWPQCLRCFHKQGGAVRSNTHKLMYNHRLRLCHFAPALALLLVENEQVCDYMTPLVESTQKIGNEVKQWLDIPS